MENVLFFTQSLLAIFIIIDAIGSVPIFISILEKFDEEDKKHVIKRATIIAFLTLLIVTFSGDLIFGLLNTNIYSFSIAGGILLSIISIEMLFGRKTKTETSEDIKDAKDDVSITPLAIPLLTGPGALTSLLQPRAQPIPATTPRRKHRNLLPHILRDTHTLAQNIQVPWKNRHQSRNKNNGINAPINSRAIRHKRIKRLIPAAAWRRLVGNMNLFKDILWRG
jgi:hypothetical protein